VKYDTKILHPYIVLLPIETNEKLKFILTLFSSGIVIVVLKLFEWDKELCQRDIIKILSYHSNKSVINALKKLVSLGLLNEIIRIEERNKRKVKMKCYSLTEIGKWYNILFKDIDQIGEEILRRAVSDLTFIFMTKMLLYTKRIRGSISEFITQMIIDGLKGVIETKKIRNLDLIVFGSIALDVYLKPQIKIYIGGSGANIATIASQLGLKTGFVGKIPGNSIGALLLSNLMDEDIYLELVEIDKSLEIPICIIEEFHEHPIISCNHKFNSPNPPVITSITNRIVEVCRNSKAIYLGEGICQVFLKLLDELGKDIEKKVIVYRPHSESLKHYLEECLSILSYSPILILNSQKIDILRNKGIDVPEDLYRYGVNRIVVTMGSRGAKIYIKGQPPIIIPAPQVNAIDTIGAGDVFSATLIYYLLQGFDLENATRKAVKIASISTIQLGPRKRVVMR